MNLRVTSFLLFGLLHGAALGQTAFTARLDGGQEIPPTASPFSGNGDFIYDVTSKLLHYDVTITGLSGGLTGAHIHSGAPGVPGPVLFPLAGGPATFSGTVGPLAPAELASLRSSGLYVNIHSGVFSSGELRGQITPSRDQLVIVGTGAESLPPSTSDATVQGTLRLVAGDMVEYDLVFSPLQGTLTAADLRSGAPGAAGPVLASLALAAPGQLAGTTPALSSLDLARLRSGLAYVSLETTAFPSGEVRGQVSGSFVPFGTGCAHDGGAVALAGNGLPVPGGQISIEISNGVPDSFGVLLVGVTAQKGFLNPYCNIFLQLPVVAVVLPLPSSGSVTLGAVLPGMLSPGTWFDLQYLGDKGGGRPYTSPGLEVNVREAQCALGTVGPTLVCKDKTVMLTATGQPAGGTYAWAIAAGGTKASIVGAANQATVVVRGDAVSAAADDVTLEVTYKTPGGKECKRQHRLTVVEITNVTANGATKVTKVTGNAALDHFVTPRGAANEKVTLTAAVVPNVAAVKAKITWDGATKDDADPLKATVAKDAAAKHVVKVNVDGMECEELRVWVVWVDFGATEIAITNNYGVDPTHGEFLVTRGGYDFTGTIDPMEIVSDADRPDLSGAKTVAPPNVPAADNGVMNKGKDLSNGATMKWDVSRQIRQKIVNPNAIALPDPPYTSDFFTTFANYPSDPLCGNDDQGAGDRDNDPYAGVVGAITSTDDPASSVFSGTGAVGNTLEIRIHFREFARLELEGAWTRVSGDFPWRFHQKWKKASEAADDQDHNGDGDKMDNVWIDDGSALALDNNGF